MMPAQSAEVPQDEAIQQPTSQSTDTHDRAQLMAQYAITFNGRHYLQGRYRYDHLADAVNHARLMDAKPQGDSNHEPIPQFESVAAPDETQRQLMGALGITFASGIYRFNGYRYDRLQDAVNYAQLQRRHAARA